MLFRNQDMTMAGSSHDPERSKTVTGPFGPDRPPTQNLNFRLRHLSEAISQSTITWQPYQHGCCVCSGLAGFGLFGWLVFIALSRVWVALGWAFLHTKRPADQLMLNPKP